MNKELDKTVCTRKTCKLSNTNNTNSMRLQKDKLADGESTSQKSSPLPTIVRTDGTRKKSIILGKRSLLE